MTATVAMQCLIHHWDRVIGDCKILSQGIIVRDVISVATTVEIRFIIGDSMIGVSLEDTI